MTSPRAPFEVPRSAPLARGRLGPLGVFGLLGLLWAPLGCPDSVVETADSPRPLESFEVRNPTPRTGNSLELVWQPPVTIYGVEVCVRDVTNEGVVEVVCQPIESGVAEPEEQRFVHGGLPFDVARSYIAMVRTQSRIESEARQANGTPLGDAPPLASLEAVAELDGTVSLSWEFGEPRFTTAGIRLLRREGTAVDGADDPEAVVVLDDTADREGLTDDGVELGRTYHYAAWVVDREGTLVGPERTSVTMRPGVPEAFAASLQTTFGAMTGAVELSITAPDDPSVSSMVVLRGANLSGPDDPTGVVVCPDLVPEDVSCLDPAPGLGPATYTAFAENGEGEASGPVTASVSVPDLRVDLFTAVEILGGYRLDWELPFDSEAVAVNVFRSTVDFPEGPDQAGVEFVSELQSPPVFDSPPPGEIAYYSAFPIAIDGVVGRPAKVSTTSLTAPVDNLVAEVTQEDGLPTGIVELTWTVPVGDYSHAVVVRNFDSTEPPSSLLDGVTVCAGVQTSCLDLSVASGDPASYGVWAVDGNGQAAAPVFAQLDLVEDLAPPAAVTNLAYTTSNTTPDSETVVLTWTETVSDDLARYELWLRTDGEPIESYGDGSKVTTSPIYGDTYTHLESPPGEDRSYAIFAIDDAENRSVPTTVEVPGGFLFIETHGLGWLYNASDATIRSYEHWVGESRVISWDALTLEPLQCDIEQHEGLTATDPDPAVLLDVGAQGSIVVRTTGDAVVMVICTTETGVRTERVVLWGIPAAFGFGLTVAPADPDGLVVDPDGNARWLVANNLVDVAPDGTVLGVDDVYGVTQLGTPGSPLNVAERLETYADGSLLVTSRARAVSASSVPIGKLDDTGSALFEAHLSVPGVEYAEIGAVVALEEGAGAGGAVLAGQLEESISLVEGTVSAPGPATAIVPPELDQDIWIVGLSSTGSVRFTLTGGSTGFDDANAAAALAGGGAVVVGELGDEPFQFDGQVQTTPMFTFPPWGFAVELDEDGALVDVVGDSLVEGYDAVVGHPAGGYVVAGRRASIEGVMIRRRGSGVPFDQWWERYLLVAGFGGIQEPVVVRAMAFDDDDRLWVVGHAYANVDFSPGDGPGRTWNLLFAVADRPRTFVAVYGASGELLFGRLLTNTDSGGTFLRAAPQSPDRHVYLSADVITPSALDDLFEVVVGHGSANEFSVQADLGGGDAAMGYNQTGGVLVKMSLATAGPEPVADLDATATGGGPYDVDLTWSAESGGLVLPVRVLRRDGQPPIHANDPDAVIVDEGVFTATTDVGVSGGQTVYYRAFRIDAFPRYGGSEIATVELP